MISIELRVIDGFHIFVIAGLKFNRKSRLIKTNRVNNDISRSYKQIYKCR